MNIVSIIREAIDKSSYTKSGLARELGITPASIAYRLDPTKDLGVAKAKELTDLLGYDIVVVPKGARLPQGATRVTSGVEEGDRGPR